MIINILISIAFYLILIYLSVNLLGYFVRGLFVNPELDISRLEEEGCSDEFVNNSLAMEFKKNEPNAKKINIIITIIALILIITYFCLLFYFWNIGVMAVAIMLMATRLPDLLWEIKNGKKINLKTMPKNTLAYITTSLDWLGLPILYYFLYIFK